MINTSYLNEFDSPLRKIVGRAEILGFSAQILQGEYVKFESSSSGEKINVKVTSEDIDVGGATLTAQGKNLLNLDRTLGRLTSGGAATEKRDFEFDKYYTGYSRANYYYPDYATSTIENGTITVVSKTAWYGIGIPFEVTPNKTYVFSGDISGDSNFIRITYYDVDGNYISVSNHPSSGFTTPDNCYTAVLSIVSQVKDGTVIVENAQIELGTTATEYEPYVEPTTYTADENGNAEVLSIYPTTVIYPNDSRVYIEKAEYNVCECKNTFYHNENLKEIVIERAGAKGKFFGFGIGQKATIKLLDKERQLNITKDNFFRTYFGINENDYVNSFPLFYVTEINRDENTNELTITAFDRLDRMSVDTVDSLGLSGYTLKEFANAVGNKYGLIVEIQGVDDLSIFDLEYPEGANFEGNESIRFALDALAEATQTIYFILENKLIFKRLKAGVASDYTINKSQYFTLEVKEPHTIGAIHHITELGDNVSSPEAIGEIQYIRNNPFWELREDIGELVENAINNIADTTITPFTCSWRGNFLLLPCDKLEFIGKDNSSIFTFLLNDKITYSGGFSQNSDWAFEKEQETAANPSTLGEALKLTYAKVDKANKQIDIVVSEVDATKEAVSALQFNTDSINASVQKVEKDLNDSKTATDETIAELTNKVEAQITAEDVTISIQKELSNGVDKVITSTGYRLDDEGFSVSKSDSDISTTITHNGMEVSQAEEEVLVANKDGVKATDLHAKTFLIIGNNSRFEDYKTNRTACFWIGG